MSITKDTQETTVQGDTFKSFVGGLIEGEGSAVLQYDNAASGETATFMDGILTTGDNAAAAFELSLIVQAELKRLALLAS